jgi:glycosyltransferase involved in cell wall biosynthesis
MTPTAALAARLAGQRTVYTVIGHPTAKYLSDHPRQGQMFAAAVRTATVTAALSRASAQATSELLGKGRATEVLPPGVRIENFPVNAAARRGPPRILFSAFAGDRRKGVDLAIAALGPVLERHPDARLQLSGAGDHRWVRQTLGADGDRLMVAVDALGAGELDDVPARYRDATVTVLPSVAEAFGLALVESLASGTPAVCNDDGGMPDIVSNDAVGRVVKPGDVPALGAALVDAIALAADPETPARCAAHARRWDWVSSVGPQHVDLYQSMLDRRLQRER